MENKEIRVYKINTFDFEFDTYEFDTSPTQWGNEKFIQEAEIQGGVYTLKGFEEAFNNQEVSADIDFIRIL